MVNAASSVTRWIHSFQEDGDKSAANKLFEYLYFRMKRLAAKHYSGNTYDSDDVANSAIANLFISIREGKYDEIADRDQLWKLAAVITLNKARNRARYEKAEKRVERGQQIELSDESLAELSRAHEDPHFQALVKEECHKLIESIKRKEVKLVALLRIEGYTTEEIAKHLKCTRRSVQRRLSLIKAVWNKMLQD